MKKIFSIVIVSLMVCMSFAIGISISVQAGDFVEPIGTGMGPSFNPTDLAWNTDGSIALAVGLGGALTPVCWFNADTEVWTGITVPNNAQNYYGVDYCPTNDVFWMCGDANGPSAAYYWVPGAGSLTLPSPTLALNLGDIAVDDLGNPLVVGDFGISFMYYFNPGIQWVPVGTDGMGGPAMGNVALHGVDFNPIDGRFYAVGELSGPATAEVFFTDIRPLTVSPKFHWEASNYISGFQKLNEITWNQNWNYGLIVGDGGVYLVSPFDGHPGNWLEYMPVIVGSTDCYLDAAWDTDGWEEAAIVGYDSVGNGVYWRFLDSNHRLLENYNNGATGVHLKTCSFKPPASPKWPMVLSVGASLKINVDANNQDTIITANAVFPKIYAIDFIDTTTASRMDDQVPLDSWYNFTCVANYSQDWANCIVEVRAWYDGNVATPGIAYPTETEDNRDLAFRLEYDVGAGTYAIMYPIAPDLEIMIDPLGVNDWVSAIHPTNPGVEDEHTVELPIWLGNQLRVADGDGWISGDDIGADGELDINNGCQDQDSWNFNVTIRDSLNPTAFNTSYSEFGIDETVSILASGNPTGNAPPGSGIQPLLNPSIITYSSNMPYWVNVSIPNLYENGVPLAVNRINCDDVYVQNVGPNATAFNSDISAQIALPAVENQKVYVWGQNLLPIPAPSNGTTSAGPFRTNYNAPLWGLTSTTQLDWWVEVQGAIPEGIYWATITITIDS